MLYTAPQVDLFEPVGGYSLPFLGLVNLPIGAFGEAYPPPSCTWAPRFDL